MAKNSIFLAAILSLLVLSTLSQVVGGQGTSTHIKRGGPIVNSAQADSAESESSEQNSKVKLAAQKPKQKQVTGQTKKEAEVEEVSSSRGNKVPFIIDEMITKNFIKINGCHFHKTKKSQEIESPSSSSKKIAEEIKDEENSSDQKDSYPSVQNLKKSHLTEEAEP